MREESHPYLLRKGAEVAWCINCACEESNEEEFLLDENELPPS